MNIGDRVLYHPVGWDAPMPGVITALCGSDHRRGCECRDDRVTVRLDAGWSTWPLRSSPRLSIVTGRREEPSLAPPRQRWGTCCPSDPHCEHSYLDLDALAAWMDSPITDEEASELTS